MNDSDSDPAIKVFEMIVDRLSSVETKVDALIKKTEGLLSLESKIDQLLKSDRKCQQRLALFCDSWDRKRIYDKMEDRGYTIKSAAIMTEETMLRVINEHDCDLVLIDLTNKLTFPTMQKYWCGVISKLRSKLGKSVVIAVTVYVNSLDNINVLDIIGAGANFIFNAKHDSIRDLDASFKSFFMRK